MHLTTIVRLAEHDVFEGDSDADRFEKGFGGLPCRRIGTVVERARLRIRSGGQRWLDLGIEQLRSASKERLADE